MSRQAPPRLPCDALRCPAHPCGILRHAWVVATPSPSPSPSPSPCARRRPYSAPTPRFVTPKDRNMPSRPQGIVRCPQHPCSSVPPLLKPAEHAAYRASTPRFLKGEPSWIRPCPPRPYLPNPTTLHLLRRLTRARRATQASPIRGWSTRRLARSRRRHHQPRTPALLPLRPQPALLRRATPRAGVHRTLLPMAARRRSIRLTLAPVLVIRMPPAPQRRTAPSPLRLARGCSPTVRTLQLLQTLRSRLPAWPAPTAHAPRAWQSAASRRTPAHVRLLCGRAMPVGARAPVVGSTVTTALTGATTRRTC